MTVDFKTDTEQTREDAAHNEKEKALSWKNGIPVSRRSWHEGLLEINRSSPVCKSKSTEQRAAQSRGVQIIFMEREAANNRQGPCLIWIQTS